MKFRFMAACRQREGDHDRLDTCLRILRAVYIVALCKSVLWFTESAWGVALGREPFEESLLHTLRSFTILFLIFASLEPVDSIFQKLRRPHILPLLMVILLTAAETTTVLGWWTLDGILGWWRQAVVVALGASLVLGISERTVLSLPSRQTPC